MNRLSCLAALTLIGCGSPVEPSGGAGGGQATAGGMGGSAGGTVAQAGGEGGGTGTAGGSVSSTGGGTSGMAGGSTSATGGGVSGTGGGVSGTGGGVSGTGGGNAIADGGVEGTPPAFSMTGCGNSSYQLLDGGHVQTTKCANVPYSVDATGTAWGDPGTSGTTLMDVVIPNGATLPAPAIIWYHPGGWFGGNKNFSVHLADYLGRGYVVIGVDYRLSPFANNADGDPLHYVSMATGAANGATVVADVKTSIQYIRTHLGSVVQPQNLIAWGVSAGADLSVLIGATGESGSNPAAGARPFALKGRQTGSDAVKAVVAQSPALDFGLFGNNQTPTCGATTTVANACGVPGMAADQAHAEKCVDKATIGHTVNGVQCGQFGCISNDGNYISLARPATAAMIGIAAGSQSLTPAPQSFQGWVTPGVWLDAQDASMYILSGRCDATATTVGSMHFQTLATNLGITDPLKLTVKLVDTAGHLETLDQGVGNDDGDAEIRAWLRSNGLPNL